MLRSVSDRCWRSVPTLRPRRDTIASATMLFPHLNVRCKPSSYAHCLESIINVVSDSRVLVLKSSPAFGSNAFMSSARCSPGVMNRPA
jgi:hypothetical protein